MSSTAGQPTDLRGSRRAYAMWGLGVLAYLVAVFQRGSLGVTGPLAQERFGASASAFALFAVLQLAVYASLQIPVGLALDRFGTRRMVTLGALVMALGQAVLATAHSVPLAVLARVLVGAGDAMTFISVLRLVPLWLPARRAPVFTQLTGILGQLGQVAATLPLLALLRGVGWQPAFLGAAAVGVLVAVVVAAALRDAPPGVQVVVAAPGLAAVRDGLRLAWREPGTRIGLWTHFSTQFSGTVFVLLWGYPFLVTGEGVAPDTAGVLLTVLVVAGMVMGPVIGRLVGGWPLRRSLVTLGVVGATATVWAVVLLWPGPAPLWLLGVLVLVLASNGPASMVGFDYARTFNPATRLGSASGIVNVGGFVASLVTILLVGLVLDAAGGAGLSRLGSFRLAFTVQYLLWGLGLVLLLRNRRVLRERLYAEEQVRLDAAHRALARRLRAARTRPGPPLR